MCTLHLRIMLKLGSVHYTFCPSFKEIKHFINMRSALSSWAYHNYHGTIINVMERTIT